MAQGDEISLGPSVSSEVTPRETQYSDDDDAHSAHQDELRQRELRNKRILVLVGSGILQLPVWGFLMSYGVFQEFLFDNWTLQGNKSLTGVVGTTSNGVVYLSMPFLFALFTRRYAAWRQYAALSGAVLTCVSFLLSSWSTQAWQLVATQGVAAALGYSLMYSPMTLSLGEWFQNSNRAAAYGAALSCKNIVGSTLPFLFRALLDRYGFRVALRIWTAVAAATGVLAILLVPTPPWIRPAIASSQRARKIPWSFLRHESIYVFGAATLFQSAGYGIPQTYISTYAHDIALLSPTTGTLLITLFNVPGIISSSFFGYLTDNKYFTLSATTVTAMSATGSALSAFLFWGLSTQGSLALLVLFSVTFGFFAGGYSSIWGGVLKEMEREASQRNEAIDTGVLYGLLNGARGIGYVTGGLSGVQLLKANPLHGQLGYGTTYGPLIIFTSLTSLLGGWGLWWRVKNLISARLV